MRAIVRALLLAFSLGAAAAFGARAPLAIARAGARPLGATHARASAGGGRDLDGARCAERLWRSRAAGAAVAARPRAPCARRRPTARRGAARMETEAATVVRLNGADDFNAAFDVGSDEQLVVVKYYASWCRACKALGPKVRRAGVR